MSLPGRTPVPTRTVIPPKGEPKNQGPFTRRVPSPKPPPKPKPGVVSTIAQVTKSLRTPAKPVSPADQAANNALAPLYASQKSDAAAQNAAIQNFAHAMLQQLQGVPGQIQNDYNTQIGQQSQLVGSAMDALRNANPNQQDQQLLQAIGAPQSQQDAIAGQNANAFNLAAGVGAYANSLPIASLRSQGLAATTLANLQPGIEGLRAQQSLAGALYQQRQAKQAIDAQRPGLVEKYQAAQADQAARQADQAVKQQQIALERQAYGLKSQNQNFNQNLAVDKQNLAVDKFKTQQDQFIKKYNLQVSAYNAKQTNAANKRSQPSAALSKSVGYLVDGSGNPILKANGKKQILPGYKVSRSGQIVKVGTTKTAGVGKPFASLSKTQVVRLRKGMNSLRFGVSAANSKDRKDHPAVGYQEAINHAISEGYSRVDATRMANRFYPPGFEGRPAKPSPDRGFRDAKLK